VELVPLLRRWKLDHLLYTLMYRRGRPPWDTGISPPELAAAVEGPEALPPGRALDIGCGTGTNCLYLASHGWHATGIDFAGNAIAKAHEKARAAGELAGSATFIRADATHLDGRDLGAPFTLLLDLGCFHSIPIEKRPSYVVGAARYAAPSALFLLYAFGPRDLGGGRMGGVTPDDVHALFAPAFAVERVVQGTDTGRGFPSAWYWLRRTSLV
jgi:SAM-dependent methyltransferase